jgi:hypothetical protein
VVNYSCIIETAARMMLSPFVIVSPSGRVQEKASRWDLVVLELAAAKKVFYGLPCWFHDFREFIEAGLGQTEPCGLLLHLLVSSRSFQGILLP